MQSKGFERSPMCVWFHEQTNYELITYMIIYMFCYKSSIIL